MQNVLLTRSKDKIKKSVQCTEEEVDDVMYQFLAFF